MRTTVTSRRPVCLTSVTEIRVCHSQSADYVGWFTVHAVLELPTARSRDSERHSQHKRTTMMRVKWQSVWTVSSPCDAGVTCTLGPDKSVDDKPHHLRTHHAVAWPDWRYISGAEGLYIRVCGTRDQQVPASQCQLRCSHAHLIASFTGTWHCQQDVGWQKQGLLLTDTERCLACTWIVWISKVCKTCCHKRPHVAECYS